jgi:hypothetical protein
LPIAVAMTVLRCHEPGSVAEAAIGIAADLAKLI